MGQLVIVAGGAGFLGRHTALKLHNDGFKVVGLGHGDCSQKDFIEWGVSDFLIADVSIESLCKLSARHGAPAYIIHCAGGSTVQGSTSEPLKNFELSVASTASILEFIRLYCPECRMVYISSVAVYGDAGRTVLKEGDPLDPISFYGIYKRMAEDLCRAYTAHWKLKCSIIRLSSLYGRGLRKQLIWDACQKALGKNFHFFGSGTEVRDWLHVKDAANIIALLMGKVDSDYFIINGGSGDIRSTREVLSILGQMWSPELLPLFDLPQREGDPSHLCPSTAKLRQLGFIPQVSLEDGLREYVAYFLDSCRRV